ncbi:PEST proteolytic signal-containing nuclear protein-like [Plodia interpunctella]|uniref:PEST proteolytic signal-containing nuclear protein-like n=1 Tax=Plodia interpunctella TaxID=58824 RepID=UPI002367B5A8|nr:PEST proteolytic signal-containing nuclear protein-like [Plodia interpunctella]
MSERYHSYGTGSSRSSRDDYRVHKARQDRDRSRERQRTRSRSRSPAKNYAPPRSSRSERSRSRSREYEDKRISTKNDWEDSDEEVPAPPPPPRITKISIDFSKPKAPIKMNLGSSGSSKKPATPAKPTVASVFNDDDDDEPEEMPAEARMRMRNIGRETPTSAGPNSFGKTKQGFCDAKKVFEKNLKQALETAEKPGKFPQTIYKIKGP